MSYAQLIIYICDVNLLYFMDGNRKFHRLIEIKQFQIKQRID